jgi:hypothetical protein
MKYVPEEKRRKPEEKFNLIETLAISPELNSYIINKRTILSNFLRPLQRKFAWERK